MNELADYIESAAYAITDSAYVSSGGGSCGTCKQSCSSCGGGCYGSKGSSSSKGAEAPLPERSRLIAAVEGVF